MVVQYLAALGAIKWGKGRRLLPGRVPRKVLLLESSLLEPLSQAYMIKHILVRRVGRVDSD